VFSQSPLGFSWHDTDPVSDSSRAAALCHVGLQVPGDEVEQAFDLGDSEGDQTGILGWLGVRGRRQDQGGCAVLA
jgi:hypothetical protein